MELQQISLIYEESESENDENDNVQEVKELVLRVHYPLMVGARITGTFPLSNYLVIDRSRRAELIQRVLLKIAKMYDEEKKKYMALQAAISDQKKSISILD